jgi:hypothetical protein
MRSYDVYAVTTASPAVVYGLLLDGATWPDWSQIDTYSWEPDQGTTKSATIEASGVRIFRTGHNVTRERVTSVSRDRMMTYEIVQGNWFLQNYKGQIDLKPDGKSGTRIRWRAQWKTPLPWVGFLMERYMRKFQQEMVNGLAQFATSPEPPAGDGPA